MHKRRLAAFAVAMSFVAVACGSDDKGSASGDSPTTTAAAGESSTTAAATETTATTAATATSAAATGGVTVRWRTRPDNDAEAKVYAGISDDIDKTNGDVALKYEPGNSEGSPYQDQLVTEIANGTAPDVFWIPGTDVARFQKEGLILDLQSLATADKFDTSEFYPEPMYHLTYDPAKKAPGGKLWGLPRDVSTFALYLNNDLIAQAGADDPRALAAAGEWNWENFAKVAKAVSALGGEKKGFAMNSWWANYGYFINSAGGSFFSADRAKCALDTPQAITGLTQMKSLYDSGSAVTWGEDGEKPWKAGTVGMFINGRWATPGARADVKFSWDVVELPKGPAGTQGNWLFWGAYVVNAKTKNPQQAWDLVKALTTVETQSKISELGANIPSRKSDAATKAFLGFSPPKNNQAFINGLADKPTAEGPLWAGDWPKFDEVMGKAVTALVSGEQTIDAFKANICASTSAAFTG